MIVATSSAPALRPFRWLLAAAVCAALSGLATPAAWADCSPAGGVHINEVRYADGNSPEDAHLNPFVELYNKGVSSVLLAGWTLTDESATVKATLGPVSLPSGAFLTVSFSSGADDLDFTDGVGTVYTNGDSSGVFGATGGAVALYSGTPGFGTIQDYVSWSISGPSPSGTAASDAVTAGLWTSGDYAVTFGDASLFTIRLLPDGFDHDSGTDWYLYGWGESSYGAFFTGANPLQIAPANGTGFDPGAITLSWAPQDLAVAYHLQVGTDPTFVSGIEIDAMTVSTDTTVTLADGGHFWRVRVVDSCGEVAAAAVWEVTMFPSPLAPNKTFEGRYGDFRAFGVLGVGRLQQHKDSQLLCLYNDVGTPPAVPAGTRRPGCTELAGLAGPWDAAHPNNHAEQVFSFVVNLPLGGTRTVRFTVQCPHCRNYCARASTQMLNAFYGGNLTQDRISYDFMVVQGSASFPQPEGDLGHDLPTTLAAPRPNIQWAIQNSAVTGPFAATYALIKAEIVAGFPARVGIPGHALIVDGYLDAGTFPFGFPTQNMVHVRDPWPTSTINGWVAYPNVNAVRFWRIRQPGAALAGRMQEAEVTADTDADGVRDFDEGAPNYPATRPRRLHSRHNVADTDNDGVADKKEIRSYTFHDSDDAGHDNDPIGFPDVDGDGRRAEADCDTDNDGDYDGGEDIDADGKSPEAGETCVYNNASSAMALTITQGPCGLMVQPTMGGGTLLGNGVFTVTSIAGCAPPDSGADLLGDQSINTTAAGAVTNSSLNCQTPGPYLYIVDAIPNGKYDPGCDPTVCVTLEPPLAVAALSALAAGPRGDAIELTWWVASRDAYVGFEIYRRAPGATEFVLVTPEPIPNAADVFPAFFRYEDATATAGAEYTYRLDALDGSGNRETFGPIVAASSPIVPARFDITSNRPNPFLGEMEIFFDLPSARTDVQIEVYDLSGRRMRGLFEGVLPAKSHRVYWDGKNDARQDLPAGVYLLKLRAGDEVRTRKLVKLQ